MTKFIKIGILFLSLLLAPAAGAQGPPVCGKRADMMEKLKNSFGEIVAGAGVSVDGFLIELLVAPPIPRGVYRPPGVLAGSWTILVTGPDKISCMAAGGDGWASTTPGSPA